MTFGRATCSAPSPFGPTGARCPDSRFAATRPSIPDLGAVVLEGNGDRMVDVAIEESSTTGVFVTGTGSTLERVTIRDSGLIGAAANFADHLTLDGVLLTGNNSEHFNHAPVSGGFKITRSQHLTIRDSVVSDNLGPGIWIDQSVLDTVDLVHGCHRQRRSRRCSPRSRIASLSSMSSSPATVRMGLKINDTGEVTIWRSTIVGNGLAVAILQEHRRGDDPSVPGHDERQPMPDPEMTWVIDSVVLGNSIIGDSRGSVRDGAVGGDGLVWVQDYSNEFTADDMGVELRGTCSTGPSDGIRRARSSGSCNTGAITPYLTLADFQDAVAGTEANRELLGDARRCLLLADTARAVDRPRRTPRRLRERWWLCSAIVRPGSGRSRPTPERLRTPRVRRGPSPAPSESVLFDFR